MHIEVVLQENGEKSKKSDVEKNALLSESQPFIHSTNHSLLFYLCQVHKSLSYSMVQTSAFSFIRVYFNLSEQVT